MNKLSEIKWVQSGFGNSRVVNAFVVKGDIIENLLDNRLFQLNNTISLHDNLWEICQQEYNHPTVVMGLGNTFNNNQNLPKEVQVKLPKLFILRHKKELVETSDITLTDVEVKKLAKYLTKELRKNLQNFIASQPIIQQPKVYNVNEIYYGRLALLQHYCPNRGSALAISKDIGIFTIDTKKAVGCNICENLKKYQILYFPNSLSKMEKIAKCEGGFVINEYVPLKNVLKQFGITLNCETLTTEQITKLRDIIEVKFNEMVSAKQEQEKQDRIKKLTKEIANKQKELDNLLDK